MTGGSTTWSSSPAVPPGSGPSDTPVRRASLATEGARSKGPWVVGAAVLIALAVVAVVVALGSHSASTTLGTGAATATVHVVVPRSGQPSFSGTVDGLALTGNVTNGSSASANEDSGTLSLGGVLFNYQGSLGGNPYILHVSIGTTSTGLSPGGNFAFHVTGTFGSEPVNATVEFNLSSSSPSSSARVSQAVTFNGTIGSQPVLGSATATQDSDGAVEVTAKLTVLPST
jgi:hypothetical protein